MDWTFVAGLALVIRARRAHFEGRLDLTPLGADTEQWSEILMELTVPMSAALLVSIQAKIRIDRVFVECLATASYET